MKGLLISAPASGAGKTIVTLGLLRAIADRNVDVVSAKSGPDYIDPGFHRAATRRSCLTLDPWALAPEGLRARAGMLDGHVLVVEGAMGLFDGADVPAASVGAHSASSIAAALEIPVVLVIDIRRMGQGAAAIAAGLARFRDDVTVAGVILNRAGSERHGEMVARAVSEIVPVLGCLPQCADLQTPSRHLGLVQAEETPDIERFVDGAAQLIEAHCDVPRILGLAGSVRSGGAPNRLRPLGQRIAVASDRAFGFSYGHMLEDWRAAGAEICPFSPLDDEPPDAAADAIFLPGGYPELHAGRIASADAFRAGMAAAAQRGALIYGECGGYMVLGEGLLDADATRHRMLGLLRLETSFATPERHLGYRRLMPQTGAPWSHPLSAHEFHYARTTRAEGPPLWQMTDAAGRPLGPTGLRANRTMGSFAHIIEPA